VPHPYVPYIPQTPAEVVDLASSMFLSAPKFTDKLGYFEEQNLETEFHALIAGIKRTRQRLGQAKFSKAVELVAQMRPLFESDPDDVNGKAVEGRKLLIELIDLLTKRTPSKN
jgi:hypothetical protein